MKCMTGSERIFRMLFGALILALGIYFHSWWGAVGLMPLMIGAIGRCPTVGAAHSFILDRDALTSKAAPDRVAGEHSK